MKIETKNDIDDENFFRKLVNQIIIWKKDIETFFKEWIMNYYLKILIYLWNL